MKLVNFQLQTQIEYLSEGKTNSHFREYLQSILEDTSKPYYTRADYIGLSIQEITSKISTIAKDIKELQALKQRYTESLEIAKELTAEIFIANGIDRIDGNILSSLTLTAPTTKNKTDITILSEKEVMQLGYVKFEVDLEAVKVALETKEGKEELKELVQVITIEKEIPAKVKINSKRTANNSDFTVDEILTITDEVA
ncbi:MAG: siphovirus Gp157 family protein [Arcobacteraceae bacterium]|nr:siphovirus Gp157 family protein [Arcobacteraceae bacterium]